MNALAVADAREWVPGYVPPLAMFLARRVLGAPGKRMDWEDVYRAFTAGPWRSVPPRQHFVQAMTWLCKSKGVRIEIDGARVYCLDCRLLA